MDKDSGSIGALRNPPPAEKELFWMSILLDIIGLWILATIDYRLIFIGLIYTAVSRLYSWNGTRLKKYPVSGWLIVVLFQGAFTFMLVGMPVEMNISPAWFTPQKTEAMLISTLLIGAYYPLTQIYQHEEDSQRGDRTISILLGIKGTFIFSTILFTIAFAVVFHYLNTYFELWQFVLFIVCLIPAILFFLTWMLKSMKDESKANFTNAMRMTLLSSTCLLVVFCLLLYFNHR
jgi:1,4-dihydroxy-2-naphthoate octaprenyltransferase